MIAISVTENNINTRLEDCFGKSRYFFLADIKSNYYKFVKNPGLNIKKMSGKRAALFLAENSVKTVISSNFGVTVKKIFDRNKIQIVLLSNKYIYLKDIEWINNPKQS